MITATKRLPVQGKVVSLFITCMVDTLYPQTGFATVALLKHLGLTIDFPLGQTCCGQPAYNAGYRREASQVAKQFITAFQDAELIVTPSGSCAAMIRHEYPRLFAHEPKLQAECERLASITWELSEFIVAGLGITNLQARLPAPKTVAIHHACHGLRQLGLGAASKTLLQNLGNATLVPWEDGETCCGFGGLFSVKMADVSGAILGKKMNKIEERAVDFIVTGDVSCLTHINGGLTKQGKRPSVRHIADVLAEGLNGS